MLAINYATANQLGGNQGQFDYQYSANSEVILDFGAQTFSGSTEGTLLPKGTSVFASYSQIQQYVEQFASGWWYGNPNSTSILNLAVGTNNSRSDRLDYGGGRSWASLVSTIRSDIAANGWSSQINVEAANDLEPAFDGPTATRNWVDGYNSINPAHLLNYGSADACPQYSASNGLCAVSHTDWGNPSDRDWNQSDVYYVSWGARAAYSLPEIYLQSMANQWSMISLYGAQSGNSGAIYFDGPLDDNDLESYYNTSDQAWTQLWSAINNYLSTSMTPSFSAQIHDVS